MASSSSAIKVAACLFLIIQVVAADTACDDCFRKCGVPCLSVAQAQCSSICTNTPSLCEDCKTEAFAVCANPCLVGCRGVDGQPCPPPPPPPSS